MKRLLALTLMSSISIAVIAGCAANLPGRENNDSFGLLSTDDGSSDHFNKMKDNFMAFLKDLNLSEDQKARFKALKDSAKDQFNNNEGKRDELKNTLKKAFLSDSIDQAALKAKLLSLRPTNDDRISLMANNLIKAYNILTPEQRTKVENKMNEVEGKIKGFMNNPIAKAFHSGGPEKRIEKMATELNLNPAQKESLQTLLKDGMPDRQAMLEKAGKIKTEIQAELKSANPNPDKIKDILLGVKGEMEAGLDKRLEKLVKVHDLLTPEQRQKLVENIEKNKENFHKKMKSRFKR